MQETPILSNRTMPRYAYIGISPDGGLEVCFSQERLSPMGARLLKGNQTFSDAIYDVFDPDIPLSRDAVLCALKDATAFLNGEEVQTITPTFGDTQKPSRRKRTP